jgi:NTP pyrophosphatase (non-canonical NTP hydrolase)
MDYEQELLTILMEECGEVIQAASKIIRFGADQANLTNLEKELGDLYCMMDLCHAYDLVSFTNMDEYSNAKYQKLKKWSNLIDD